MIDLTAVKAGRGLTERGACQRLAEYARQVPADAAIVELGSFRGRTAAWLAYGAEVGRGNGAVVYAVDPWTDLEIPDVDGYVEIQYERGDYAAPTTLVEFHAHLARCAVDGVATIQATATEAASIYDGPPVGLLFHDALHTADAVAEDLAAWIPHMAPASTIACHDVSEPRFGVLEGAARVLPAAGYQWPPTIHRWKKAPDRRGLMVTTR